MLTMTDESPLITLRTRRFITNRLLCRRQFIIDIYHPSRPNVRLSDLVQKLAFLYKTESSRVVVFGLRTHFGGGESTGYVLIYDDEAAQRRNEPKYRLVRSGLVEKTRPVGHHLRKHYKVMAKSAKRRERRYLKKARRAQNKHY